VLSAASRVYVVATPEVAAIRDLSRLVDRLIHVDDSTEKLHVVLNRSESPFAISVEQIEKAMRLPIQIKISNSYPELIKAENLGEPIPIGSKGEISADFSRWADSLVGVSRNTPSARKGRRLRDLWGNKSLATQS
jgi:pilus assembly protein CpaE